MASAPIVSIVICTHNREDRLPLAIESVLRQETATAWELIVVDNRSSDGTRDVVARYADGDVVRYVFEDRLGLSHARNTGWQMARGRYVAYLDDDAIAETDWVAAIVAAFENFPEAGVVGGRVDPIWERPRPPWLSDRLTRVLSVVDWSVERMVIHDPDTHWIAGANMAIPRGLLSEVGGFSPALGRRGGNLVSNEETHLELRLVRAGHPCLYDPRIRVRHLVPAARLSRRWLMRRFFWQGVSDVVMTAIEDPSRIGRARSATAELTRLLARPWQVATAFIPTDDPRAMTARCATVSALGRLAGFLGAR